MLWGGPINKILWPNVSNLPKTFLMLSNRLNILCAAPPKRAAGVITWSKNWRRAAKTNCLVARLFLSRQNILESLCAWRVGFKALLPRMSVLKMWPNHWWPFAFIIFFLVFKFPKMAMPEFRLWQQPFFWGVLGTNPHAQIHPRKKVKLEVACDPSRPKSRRSFAKLNT